MLSLKCFGRLTVEFAGTCVHIRCEKARELLALLIVEKGRPMRKERVAGILWPTAWTRRALDSLYKAIRSIRDMEQTGIHIPLISTRNEVCLQTDSIEADIFLFEDLCKDKSIDALERAVSLYSAPFLADEYYEWSFSHQAYYEVMFTEAIRRLIQHFEDCGNSPKQRYYQSLLNRP
jgi:two-component SAPR family response regulator